LFALGWSTAQTPNFHSETTKVALTIIFAVARRVQLFYRPISVNLHLAKRFEQDRLDYNNILGSSGNRSWKKYDFNLAAAGSFRHYLSRGGSRLCCPLR
jgi:hypothetical protein